MDIGTIIWETLIFIIVGYMIGSVLGAQIANIIFKKSIKNKGSKNQGATNAVRVAGKRYALIVVVFDIIKPIIAFFIIYGMSFALTEGIIQIGAFFTVIGHMFPWTSGFKGGKGVATTIGLFLMINWIVCLSIGIAWIITYRITRTSSLTSLIVFWTVGMLVWIPTFWQNDSFNLLITDALINFDYSSIYSPIIITIDILLVTIKHHANIKKIIKGTESTMILRDQPN